jgi:hypothetical protein
VFPITMVLTYPPNMTTPTKEVIATPEDLLKKLWWVQANHTPAANDVQWERFIPGDELDMARHYTLWFQSPNGVFLSRNDVKQLAARAILPTVKAGRIIKALRNIPAKAFYGFPPDDDAIEIWQGETALVMGTHRDEYGVLILLSIRFQDDFSYEVHADYFEDFEEVK